MEEWVPLGHSVLSLFSISTWLTCFICQVMDKFQSLSKSTKRANDKSAMFNKLFQVCAVALDLTT